MKQIGITSDGQGLIVEVSHKEAGLIGEGLRQIRILVENIMAGLPFMAHVATPKPENAPVAPKSAAVEATAASEKPAKVKTQDKAPAPPKAACVKLVRKPGKPKQSWKAELVKIMDGKGMMSVADVVAAVAAAKGIKADTALAKAVGQCLAGKPNRDAFTRVATGQYTLTTNAPVAPAKTETHSVNADGLMNADPASLTDEQLRARMVLVAKAGKSDQAARMEFIKRKAGGDK